MKFRKIFFIIFGVISVFGCKEAFEPEVIAGNNNYLVVEGYINTGGGETTVNLSRTSGLKEADGFRPETEAEVSVEGEDGTVVYSGSQTSGVYTIPTYNLKSTVKYRLHISTKGKEYMSDYLDSKQTPEIDTVSWKREKDGVQIYVNTHDPLNKTQYYKWDYKETWQIQSLYQSTLEYINGEFITRDPTINITNCWAYNQSTRILIGSSAGLVENKINLNPITFINPGSAKLDVKYSIMVFQYGLSEKGYQYYRNMKKNTEQIGGLFDSQPSEIGSNVHCVSSSNEVVIGYILAGTVSQRRIFIDKREIPEWTYPQECNFEKIPVDSASTYADKAFLNFTKPGGVFIADAICVDCRLKGSNIRPDYWPIK
ncbi:MAG: hypothetical protein JWN56_1507 [Sphingobacteriales bacterium]|nr:hypothetical protein [Sphingobacteriales bacterium]